MKSWMVILAREGARVFAQESFKAPLRPVMEMANPDGKKKDRELATDRPGRNFENGSLRHAFANEVSPREQVLKTFLKEVADRLTVAFDGKEFENLILAADPHVMGMIRPELSKRVSEKVSTIITKNLFHAETAQLTEALDHAA